MKIAFRLISLATLISLVSSAFATIRFVSPNPGSAPYTTINAAYSAATTGDTIVMGPGNYSEALGFTTKRIHFIGAGWDVCTWTGYVQISNPATAGSVFEGFRFIGSGSHSFNSFGNTDSLTLRRCHISPQNGFVSLYIQAGKVFVNDCVLNGQGNQTSIVQNIANGNVVFRNTIFNSLAPSGSHNAINGANGATIEIYNCVFLNFITQFNVTGVPQVIGLNNIFYDWGASPSYGTLPVGSVFEYTASGGAAPAFPASFTNNISLNGNPFVSYATAYYQYGVTDLHLNDGSVPGLQCVDAGYPSILDLDSTASDLGIYGGPKPFVDHGIPAFPFALTLTIDNLVEVGDSVNVVSSGRIGPRY